MAVIKHAIAAQPRRRQEASTPASASAESTSSDSSSPSETSKPSGTSKPSDISSTTSAPPLPDASSVTTSLADGQIVTLISLIRPPPFTATSSTAYLAPGVNATSPAVTTPTYTPFTTSSTPTTTTTASSTYVDPVAQAIASAQAPGIPVNQLTACQINGTEAFNGPFCSPLHLQELYAGITYAITWNPYLFAENATNHVELRYNGTSDDPAWTSPSIANFQGYVDIQMDKAWLLGAPGNDSSSGQNLTLFLISEPAGQAPATTPGPDISLVVDPKTLPPVLIPKIANKYGLKIGLPIGLVALIILFFSFWYAIKRQTKHNSSIRLVSRDYMAKRARRKRRGGDVPLEDYDMDKQDHYMDQPVVGGAGRENFFRAEVAKQRAEDDASLRRVPSSF